MDGIDIINELKLDNNDVVEETLPQIVPVKGKRGRRSKKEIEMAKALENKMNNSVLNDGENEVILQESKQSEEIVKQPPKKRGRKPKGGKIVQQTVAPPPKKEEIEMNKKPKLIFALRK